MKVFYEEPNTHVAIVNQQELLNYLLTVDCYSETPVNYTARIVASKDMNYKTLVISISKYKTTVAFTLFLADGVSTSCLTRQYDNLEAFRYNLKEFFEYIDTIAQKVEKEKDYNNLLKKLTPKPIKEPKTKPATSKEVAPNEAVCNRVEKYRGSDGMIYTRYIYTRGGI